MRPRRRRPRPRLPRYRRTRHLPGVLPAAAATPAGQPEHFREGECGEPDVEGTLGAEIAASCELWVHVLVTFTPWARFTSEWNQVQR